MSQFDDDTVGNLSDNATMHEVAALLRAVPASAQGYRAGVLIAWGDPVSDGPEFRQDAGNSAFEQEWQWGMHNDGVVYFPIRGSKRGLIVQNHEYTDDVLLFPDGTANWNQEKTNKSLAAHGVGIIEVRKNDNGRWRVLFDDRALGIALERLTHGGTWFTRPETPSAVTHWRRSLFADTESRKHRP